MAERIVLYRDIYRGSPLPERVELALIEAGAQYTVFVGIDPKNKPAWYKDINPRLQVPVLTYGGPDVPPDQPSPESAKLYESPVLLEFVADIFPESGLLPPDPVTRARIRLFADVATTKFGFPLVFDFIPHGKSTDAILAALEEMQTLLPANAKFAVGDRFTLADAALAPFLWRFEICLKHDVGKFTYEEGKKTSEEYGGERFARLRSYFNSIKARQAFIQAALSEEKVVEFYGDILKYKRD